MLYFLILLTSMFDKNLNMSTFWFDSIHIIHSMKTFGLESLKKDKLYGK